MTELPGKHNGPLRGSPRAGQRSRGRQGWLGGTCEDLWMWLPGREGWEAFSSCDFTWTVCQPRHTMLSLPASTRPARPCSHTGPQETSSRPCSSWPWWLSPEICPSPTPWFCSQWCQSWLCSWCHRGVDLVARSKGERFCQDLEQGPLLYPTPLWQSGLLLVLSLSRAYCCAEQLS